MLKPVKRKLQTYADGWGTSYEVSDRRIKAEKQHTIHYENYSVGVRRYYEAQVADRTVNRVILVPETTNITEGDLFIDSDGTQYEVGQVDRKDTRPISLLVSLQSAPITYRRASNE